MVYTQVLPKPEMLRCRMRYFMQHGINGAMALVAVMALAGCATYDPLTAYHHYEGGAIGHNPPPAPGLNDKYPNLASVPPKPPVLSPLVQHAVRQQLLAANQHQNAMPMPGTVAVAAVKPNPPPLVAPPATLIAFEPHRAILSHQDRLALKALVAQRAASPIPGHGLAPIAAIGFAPDQTSAGLKLALLRATAIADALAVAGVPVSAIRIEALAAGRGGAAQLLYPETT
jgi:hypothetical protein